MGDKNGFLPLRTPPKGREKGGVRGRLYSFHAAKVTKTSLLLINNV
jgi:hypothetical protein